MTFRPHVLGIDDGPFDKQRDTTVPIVGVMMEGPDLLEALALGRFEVDGDAAADYLADWIAGLRFASALHAVVLGGVTIAGLGLVDIERLAVRLARPVMLVNRRRPRDEPLVGALRAAGLEQRIEILERMPAGWDFGPGLHVTHAGSTRAAARRILSAVRGKSLLPEPLRVAHLIGAALVHGESRGRP